MNGFEKFIRALQYEIPHMTSFGWYHFLCLGLTIGGGILTCLLLKNSSEKANRIFLGVVWGVMLFTEIYKQVVCAFNYNGGDPYWAYSWNSFPFQLCSSPLYILPFAAFIKNEKWREPFEAFLSFFALFGGLCVMVFPNDVFNTDFLGIALQTMIHHGLMVVVGVYLIVRNRKKLTLKYFAKGVAVFAVMLSIAMILNETVVLAVSSRFNMFFISRHYPCTLPLLEMIYPKVPYVVFLLIYIIGFALVGLLIWSVSKLIYRLATRKGKDKVENEA